MEPGSREQFTAEMREQMEDRLAHPDRPSHASPQEHHAREADIDAAFRHAPGYLEADALVHLFETTGKGARDKEKRREACQQVIRQMFEDPYLLEGFYSSLDRLDTPPDMKEEEGATSEAVVRREQNSDAINGVRRRVDSLLQETIEGAGKEGRPDSSLRLGFSEKNRPVIARWLELYT